MSWTALIITFCIGLSTVLQGSLNKQLARTWGLSPAVVFNNIVIFTTGLLLYALVRMSPQRFPELFKPKEAMGQMNWWYVLPGLFGLAVVTGIPWAISQIGALKVFLIVVAAQMVGSVLWDIYVENIPLNNFRALGVLLALSGALITYLKG